MILQWGLHETVYSRKAKKAFKSNIKEWRKKFGQWSTQSKTAAITEFLYPGIKGLIYLIGFERYEALNEQQRRQTLASIFAKNGLLIAIQIYARIRPHIVFGGIWAGSAENDPIKTKHRQYQQLVFVERCESL